MSFICNSCFALLEIGRLPNEPCILTSCFHVLCNACSQRIQHNQCVVCTKQCQTVAINKDMPPSLKTYFDPPLTKIEKIQQQLKFLKQQQDITFKMKKEVEAVEKKKAAQIQKILVMEQKAKAKEQQLQNSIKSKMEAYRNMKDKYQKLDAEEARFIKFFKEHGLPVDQKNVSADSGMHSFEKSARYEQ